MSVIAHVDHGKTTLTDSLISVAGYVRKEDIGTASIDKSMKQQADRGITIKSTGVSLNWRYPENLPLPVDTQDRNFLVNLIDSPGHVDFSSEVTAALRLTDGALVVIDCVEGSAVQTSTVLRQALAERIRPVLTINKLDRAFIELQLTPEEMYQSFCRSIESANVVLAEVGDDGPLGRVEFNPLVGNVAFSAGLHGWAFTLPTFARLYSRKLGASETQLIRNFWGDRYYDHETRKFQKTPTSQSGKQLSRTFCEFILEPISRVFRVCLAKDHDRLKLICSKLEVPFSNSWLQIERPKDLLKAVMQEWLPASENLLEMIVRHLPSPKQAQQYRTEILYDGPLDDATAQAIRNCDADGPTVMYVAKMVPNSDYTRFFAFGRVFSGTLKPGQQVHILQSSTDNNHSAPARIQNTLSMLGKKMEAVDFVPCGNTCAISGVDKHLTKNGTIVSDPASCPIRSMKYSVSPVVRLAVAPSNPGDLPKFVEGLKRLTQFDPLLLCITTPTEHIIAGAGELHLEVCLHTLREDILKGMPINVSPPIVEYRETILGTSSNILAKSRNKHNRLWMAAEPVSEDFTTALENATLPKDPKELAAQLRTHYAWNPQHTKVWTFAPEGKPDNTLVEAAFGVQYLQEVKDSIVQGFHWAMSSGPLTEEPVRGVKVVLQDASLHSDSAHRGPSQLVTQSGRCVRGALLTAQPTLLEPIYSVEIQCPATVLSGIYSVISARRGKLIEDAMHPTLPLRLVTVHLPVAESFGFSAVLSAETGGQAFPSCSFSHWAKVPGSPFDEGSICHQVVQAIRKRKGLPAEIPPASAYVDKL